MQTHLRGALASLLILATTTFTVADHGAGAGSTFHVPSADPLAQGRTTATVRYEFTDLESPSDARLDAMARASQDGHAHATDRIHRYYLEIERGLTEDFSLGVTLSGQEVRNYREMHFEGGMVERKTADPSGFEDIWVRGRYRIIENDRSRTALLGGIKLPTGDNRNRNSTGGIIDLGSQPSSGSLDAMIGLALQHRLASRLDLEAGATYTARGEGPRNRSLGNRADAGIQFVYHAPHGSAWDMHLHLGAAVAHNRPSREDIVNEANSGGTAWFATPGFTLSRGDWSLGAHAGIPISEDLNGLQQEHDYHAVVSLTRGWGGRASEASGEGHAH